MTSSIDSVRRWLETTAISATSHAGKTLFSSTSLRDRPGRSRHSLAIVGTPILPIAPRRRTGGRIAHSCASASSASGCVTPKASARNGTTSLSSSTSVTLSLSRFTPMSVAPRPPASFPEGATLADMYRRSSLVTSDPAPRSFLLQCLGAAPSASSSDEDGPPRARSARQTRGAGRDERYLIGVVACGGAASIDATRATHPIDRDVSLRPPWRASAPLRPSRGRGARKTMTCRNR